jgi:iron complex outermembrane receptor protein
MLQITKAMKIGLYCGCAAAALAGSSAAWAQQGSQVSEIVVTAQRRAEKLEDVPMSITAITGDAVQSRGASNLQDLGMVMPGVQIGFQGSFTYPAVRGITSATTGVGFENNVGIYIDGYYQPDVNSINQDFANIESIQVLKGPQGALYGRNATGGAILITTPKPSSTLTGAITAKYGSFNDRNVHGYVSGPITDRVRYSLSGYYRKSDGYYDLLNAQGQEIGDAARLHNYSARAKIEADITDDLTATLAYSFNELSDARGSMFTYEQYRGGTFGPGVPKVGRLYDPRTFAGNHVPKQLTHSNEGTLTLAWTTPIGTLTSYTGYAYRRNRGDFDFDGGPPDTNFNVTRYIEDTFQQTVDYVVDAVDNLDLVVGATYYDDRTKARYSDAYSGFRRLTRQLVTYGTKAWAVYADGTYHVSDRLAVSAGGRYTEERRETRFAAISYPTATSPGVYTVPPLYLSAAGDPKVKFTNFSPRVSVRYEVAPDTNVYASVSRGFRSGFLQQVPNAPIAGQTFVNVIQPEKITAFEVGFKTAQRMFRFDTSVFYYDDKNFHVGLTIPNPANPLTPFNITSNAKKAKVYGIEAQGVFMPIEDLEISLGATFLNARFRDFAGAQATGLNTATGLNVSQTQNWNGQQMIRSPDFAATLAVTYTMRDVAGGELVGSVNAKYTDSYVLNAASLYGPLAGPVLATQQRWREGAYTLVNGSLNWTDPSEHYTVGVWVNNAFNLKYHLSRNGNIQGGDYGTWAWPRQVGARVGYKF